MAQLPPATEQVLRVHAAFIHTVVNALRDRSQITGLMNQLKSAEEDRKDMVKQLQELRERLAKVEGVTEVKPMAKSTAQPSKDR